MCIVLVGCLPSILLVVSYCVNKFLIVLVLNPVNFNVVPDPCE